MHQTSLYHDEESVASGEVIMKSWDSIETPLGSLFIAVNEKGVFWLEYGGTLGGFLTAVGSLPRQKLSSYTGVLADYFEGKTRIIDLPFDISSQTEFRQKALSIVSRIPYGEVRTYGQIASELGNIRASRAVGQAMRHNPVPLIIPCHRVVSSSGLGGYGGQMNNPKKEWLLAFEGVSWADI